MPITYNMDTEAGTLFVTWRGEVSLQELVRHWNTLLTDATFPAISRALTDLRESTLDFSSTELWRTIDDHYREVIGQKPLRIAILVATEEHEKFAGVWKTLAPRTVTASLFHDHRQASVWLAGSQGSAPKA